MTPSEKSVLKQYFLWRQPCRLMRLSRTKAGILKLKIKRSSAMSCGGCGGCGGGCGGCGACGGAGGGS